MDIMNKFKTLYKIYKMIYNKINIMMHNNNLKN